VLDFGGCSDLARGVLGSFDIMARLKSPNEMTLSELETHLEMLGDDLSEARYEAPNMLKGIRAEIKNTKDLIKARKAGVKPDKMVRNTKARPFATSDINWLKNYVACARCGYSGYTTAEAKIVQAEIDLRAAQSKAIADTINGLRGSTNG
jgi:hypothetical protein